MFETKFYTYWADADPAGIVFFPHFFRYVEQAEEELFRASGANRQALLEETVWDRRNARVVNSNFADYHVPAHADVPALEALFVDSVDKHVNPLGAKGLAELALVGVAPAIANAVYHATGRRVRDLPITPEKLL